MTYPVLVLGAVLAQTSTSASYSVNPQKSVLGYTVVHKFHKVRGESKMVQGKAVLRPDGSLQVMVRVPVSSFESGDGNRDEHMREALEAPKYPFVTYKGVAKVAGGALPAKLDLVLDGQLEFHGRKQAEKVPVHVETAGPGRAHATGRFAVSLDRYQIERPSLLFIKIDDACAIDFDLALDGGAP